MPSSTLFHTDACFFFFFLWRDVWTTLASNEPSGAAMNVIICIVMHLILQQDIVGLMCRRVALASVMATQEAFSSDSIIADHQIWVRLCMLVSPPLREL